jgi:hypothetical protein
MNKDDHLVRLDGKVYSVDIRKIADTLMQQPMIDSILSLVRVVTRDHCGRVGDILVSINLFEPRPSVLLFEAIKEGMIHGKPEFEDFLDRFCSILKDQTQELIVYDLFKPMFTELVPSSNKRKQPDSESESEPERSYIGVVAMTKCGVLDNFDYFTFDTVTEAYEALGTIVDIHKALNEDAEEDVFSMVLDSSAFQHFSIKDIRETIKEYQ